MDAVLNKDTYIPLLNSCKVRERIFILIGLLCIVVSFLPIQLIGWGILAFYILKKPFLGILLSAFFAPFFEEVGIVHLFFALKPFQFFTILTLMSVIKAGYSPKQIKYIVVSRYLFLIVFLFSTFVFAFTGDVIANIRTSLNFSLIILWLILATMLIDDRNKYLWIFSFFCAGLAAKLAFLFLQNAYSYKAFLRESHNYYGLFFIVTIFAGVILSFYTKKWIKLFSYVLAASAFVSLWLLFSRGSCLAFIFSWCSVCILLCFVKIGEKKRIVKTISLFSVIFLLLAFFFYSSDDYLKESYNSLFSMILELTSKHFSTKEFQEENIAKVQRYFGDKTAYFAYSLSERRTKSGIEAYRKLRYSPFLGKGLRGAQDDFSHSLYIEFFGATGAVGILAWLAFVFSLIGRILRLLLSQKSTAVIKLLLLGFIVSWLVQSLVETYYLQFYIWVAIFLATFEEGDLADMSSGRPTGGQEGCFI